MARAPRHSVAGAAKTATRREEKALSGKPKSTQDSFVNFVSKVGIGAQNQSSGGGYWLNPITRLRVELEWAYRGSWIVRAAIDAVADDMVRAGIELGSDLPPDDGDRLLRELHRNGTWQQLNEGEKWARLYGGCIVVPIIDGQNTSEPLRPERIAPGQYKGIIVLDRWTANPSLEDLVTEKDEIESTTQIGLPRYYNVLSTASALPRMRIHYTRAWRLGGADLPFQQRLTENLWDLSVIEPLFDRLVAFDSATQGAAQLVYRAYLRTLKLQGLTDILGMDEQSPMYRALTNRIHAIREFQTNEGLTLLDVNDALETHQYSFGGLSEMILQFGEQIAGATGIPLVRLFGQSPAGLNSTGESDLRMYYDTIAHRQELQFRTPLDKILKLTAKNLRVVLPDDFWWNFKGLWQMREPEKAEIARVGEAAVADAFERGIISQAIAMQELKQQSRVSGYFTNISDEDIEDAAQQAIVPSPEEMGIGAHEPGSRVGGEGGGEGGEEGSGSEGDNLDLGDESNTSEIHYPHLHLVADAGTYGFDYHGLPVFIETPKGEMRPGRREKMPADYGYIRMSGSSEGPAEGIDCYVGGHRDSRRAWIINQVDPETGEFDEHKILLGYNSRKAAVEDYSSSHGETAVARIGSVKEMSINSLHKWLQTHPVYKAA